MCSLPTGTVTFLYTDIEGSTRRWDEHPGEMKAAVERHDAILREAVEGNEGVVFRTEGDAFRAAFTSAPSALDAALAAQRALNAERWDPAIAPIRVRVALHTGAGELGGGDYTGQPLNRVARLLATAHGGQVVISHSTYNLVRDTLPTGADLRDLGEHRLKDLQRPEHIFQLVVADLPSDFPPLITLDSRPNNLPVQRTPMVGREKELAAVQQLLLRDDVGLLTLIGPGGTGKTRLALQVAADLADEFPDGVFLVPLASISDPDLVPSALAQALEVKETAGQSLIAGLKDYLRAKRLLLVLDNFEQVVEAAPVVAELLAAAPRLKALATSREVLRLRGEQEFHVPPLGLPDLKHLPAPEALSQYEAVALFIQRARLVQPDFRVTNENAPAVAEICYRLDGLPLAIELAAARIRLLPPQAMLARLQSRLKLLTGGARDLPARQQTLRGAIQWSYDLLPPPEQMLFRRLSVFMGGATLEAAEEVCNPGVGGPRAEREPGIGDQAAGRPDPRPPTLAPLDIDVLDGAASLVDKSLLRQERGEGDESRIVMLETIREYAVELLEQTDAEEAEELRRRHASFYLGLAERAERGFMGREQRLWLDRLEEEHDNIRAIMQWAIERQETEIALRLSTLVSHFWWIRGYFGEARRWLEGALALPGAQAPTASAARARAAALTGLLAILWQQDNYGMAVKYGEEGVALWRELGQPATKSMYGPPVALIYLGATYWFQGDSDYDRARQLTEEGLAILRRQGDKWLLGVGLLDLGLAANAQGDYATARTALEESMGLFRAVGDKWGLTQVLNVLGDLARIEGDYARAKELYEEGLAGYQELNIRVDIPASLHNLGYAELGLGNVERAREHFVEALNLQRDLANKHGIIECLSGLAGVAGAKGEAERAARLFGATTALREAIAAPFWPAEAAENERNQAIARAQLDQAAWDKAWAQGTAMSQEQAIEYALAPL